MDIYVLCCVLRKFVAPAVRPVIPGICLLLHQCLAGTDPGTTPSSTLHPPFRLPSPEPSSLPSSASGTSQHLFPCLASYRPPAMSWPPDSSELFHGGTGDVNHLVTWPRRALHTYLPGGRICATGLVTAGRGPPPPGARGAEAGGAQRLLKLRNQRCGGCRPLPGLAEAHPKEVG